MNSAAFVICIVSANQTQPLKRKAEASNETSALIIRAIYLYFTTGYYTSLPTAVTLLYSQLLYLTVSLLTVWWKCHAPRHYRFKLCFSWIRPPLGQDGQQIEHIPIDIKLISFCCFDDAHNCCTCSGSFFRVAKKEILSVDAIPIIILFFFYPFELIHLIIHLRIIYPFLISHHSKKTTIYNFHL